ncbi:unnamed protein product [Closterium sp. Yama58-4]|nr:unnamed protein product [Closterium sp. Yama58-4]
MAKASRVLLCLVAASVLLALLPCSVHSADSANVSAEEAAAAAAAESARATAEAVAKAAESAAAKDEAAEKAAEEAATAREGDKGAEEEAQSPIPPAIAQAEKAASDIVPDGACKKEIADFCGDLTVGNRTVERCLTGQVQLLKSKGGQGTGSISPGCLQEVYQFKIELYKNISLNNDMGQLLSHSPPHHATRLHTPHPTTHRTPPHTAPHHTPHPTTLHMPRWTVFHHAVPHVSHCHRFSPP